MDNSQDRIDPLGSGLLNALVNTQSHQHVLKHACGLSTLLFNLWWIDSEAAAGGGTQCVVITFRSRCESRANVCSKASPHHYVSDSQLAETMLTTACKHWPKPHNLVPCWTAWSHLHTLVVLVLDIMFSFVFSYSFQS